MKHDLCIYHANCTDGVAAAWAVWSSGALGAEEFYPGVYGKPPPEVSGKHVVVVDFSYKYDVMVELARQAESILVLDHHATAREDLKRLTYECSNVELHFDMGRCGALMAWDHFHPVGERPALLREIDAHDRWLSTRDDKLIMALRSYPHSWGGRIAGSFTDLMHTWSWLMHEDTIGHLRREGESIHRYYRQRVAECKTLANTITLTNGGRYFRMPCVNGPYAMASDAGNELANGSDVGMAAVWWVNSDRTVSFSLRSVEGQDVSSIARHYGGGGHACAAGFSTDLVLATALLTVG